MANWLSAIDFFGDASAKMMVSAKIMAVVMLWVGIGTGINAEPKVINVICKTLPKVDYFVRVICESAVVVGKFVTQ
jgi:hypothetical protein